MGPLRRTACHLLQHKNVGFESYGICGVFTIPAEAVYRLFKKDCYTAGYGEHPSEAHPDYSFRYARVRKESDE